MRQRITLRLWSAAMLTGIALIPTARAQDPAAPARRAPRAFHRALVTKDLVSEPVVAEEVAATEATRKRLEHRLAWEITRLDQVYGLTAEQKKKLEIAGRGDIKRLFERIRADEQNLGLARDDFARARDFAELGAAMRKTRGLTQDIPEKLFIEGSIFAKTLKKTFRPEQREKYEKDRREFYRSRVEWAVASGLGVLHLNDDQRRRLVTLIVENNRPLRRYGRDDFQAVMLQASRLPEDALKPIFDEAQWRRLRAGFEEVKRIEEVVIADGYLPEDEDPPAADAPPVPRQEDRHKTTPG
jgi:hypothetical protein